ncbi:cytochrome P450 [Thermoflavimicrobium dichotomicum]|uniref:Cytochrome P450 n=1 Tax=Thermoflavimicrobium dichotomicum TaxID=46223 RepID=A0A1I3KIQ1_9BACL|nr:cytochrome P450 [Thermoflavimicrobium dichotomicum]SFI72188.1 Cytochrome P450 [Thermoflavimicrobium dichotomicum]
MKVLNRSALFFMKELDTAEKRLQPFSVFNQLRETTPIRYDHERQCWDLFLYEDVHEILKTHAVFSSERKRTLEANTILTMDPPRHTKMRNIVNKAFTVKSVQNLAPRIQEIVHQLIDLIIQQGQMEVVRDLSAPLPVIMIAELLGVPKEDRLLFKEWSDVAIKGVDQYTEEHLAAVAAEHKKAQIELSQYFTDMMNQRRTEPKDDLITALLRAEVDGEKLTDKEIIDFCILLLIAGNETTTNLITHGIRLLTEQPDIQEQVAQDSALIPSFIEETLRYYPPVLGVSRVAKQEIEIYGQKIHQGEVVMAWVAAANRDPRVFSDPDTFVVNRTPNHHLTFGKGIHFCLGAPLARLEAKIAFEEIFKRLTEIRLQKGTKVEINPSPLLYGLKEYPVTFQTV